MSRAELHHERLVPTGTTPTRWILFTHGILGSGSNWRSIARAIIARRPTWGAVLCDLRLHGRSTGGTPPHTLAACADDIDGLVATLAADGVRIDATCGHSFGGKVMLAVRATGVPLAQTWVLDSTPSARPGAEDDRANTVVATVALLERLPRAWPRREDFVAAVIEAGNAKPFAQWLAMNLEAVDGAYHMRLDLDGIRALLVDYYVQDLWPAVERADLPGEVRMVVAERSGVVSAADRARLATAPPHVRVDTVAGAGHWLHLDAPAAVIDLIATGLP